MSKLGKRLIQAAKEGRADLRGRLLHAEAEIKIVYSYLQDMSRVGEPESGLDYMLRHSNAAVNATIERCAQVADELRLKYKTGLACDPAIDAVLEMIAARIRALKD